MKSIEIYFSKTYKNPFFLNYKKIIQFCQKAIIKNKILIKFLTRL